MELWIGAVNLGFLYAFMAIGVFITFRIHDFPDITVDGSFTAGAATSAVLLLSGVHPLLSVTLAGIVGAICGSATAFLHTRFRINGLLAGILVMTGLYSINLHIMGRSNIPLLNRTTVFSMLDGMNPGMPGEIWLCLALLVILGVFWGLSALFFKTDLGIAMRITGNNPVMAAANGVNVSGMTIFGVALANGFVAVSGALVAQYQGFADIGMGIGSIVIGLAAVIIGESMVRSRSMFWVILSVILGSLLFRLMIAFALFAGMNPIDLKLLTALFVLITLIASKSLGPKADRALRTRQPAGGIFKRYRWGVMTGVVLFAAGLISATAWWKGHDGLGSTGKPVKIGFCQISDHGLLNITRDSFVEELARLGYKDGRNCRILLENANGDLSTVPTILDRFIQEDVDVVVPISTACTQAAVNRIRDRPVVFATVANPFIIGAGTSETDHMANVTGVYGWVPMEQTLRMVREVIPGDIRIGTMWDPAHANSVFNVENLKQAVASSHGVTLIGTTITGSAEVYQAARSLVNRDIDAFVLTPDNIVYSAFEAVVKAAQTKKIPIFLSDVERLVDGAFAALGYDYSISGVQAARLVNRVLKGESPQNMPFERYHRLFIGFNRDVAEQLGIEIPESLLKQATHLVQDGEVAARNRESLDEPGGKRIALFIFNESPVLVEAARGLEEELRATGVMDRYRITLDLKNAQNDFHMAQSVAQDIVRERYDFIVTMSTPALQVTAQVNHEIPHVFGAVTDPYRMGVARSSTDHLPQLTGVATFQPVEATFEMMRTLFPEATRIGMVWNTAEACSEACTMKARVAAKTFGFELLEANVSSTGEVMDSTRSLVSRGVDLFFSSGDNTVSLAVPTIAAYLRSKRIPYFTNTPADVENGAFLSIGADYFEVGRETARQAVRVIEGKPPAELPIRNYVPEKLFIHQGLAMEYGVSIPHAVLQDAAKVFR